MKPDRPDAGSASAPGAATAAAASLRARRIGIDTWRENVVYLRRDCPVVRAEGFQALAKVEVAANGRTILAMLNVVDDERLLGERELGLSEESWAQLAVADGTPVAVRHAEPPPSMWALKRKIAGERLGAANSRRSCATSPRTAIRRSNWRPSWSPPTSSRSTATRCFT
jgi:hypothetical protein